MKYSIMNGYENYPEKIGSDIDICVESITEFEKQLLSISREQNFKLVQKLEHHSECINYFIAKKFDSEWIVLSLDIYVSYVYKSHKLFDSNWFLTNNSKLNCFYIPKPENEFVYYLVKKIIKQDIDSNLNIILEKYSKLKNQIDFSKFFPKSFKALNTALETSNKEYFSDSKALLKKELDSSLKFSMVGFAKELLRKFKRIIRPTGLTISFLGPDGSGKSTIITALIKQDTPFRRNDYFHLKPRFIGPKGDGKPVANPHAKKAYPGILSYLKAFHFIFDYWLGWPKILKLKIKSSLVIFDRYYDDFYIDPKRFRYGGNIIFAKFLKKFVPQPDICFVLIAEPEVIYARKQEVVFDELQRQIKMYKSLESSNCILINVDQDVEQIVQEVLTHIYGKLNARY
jgi:thymidylate kinase